jgi:hypothetical protein
VTTRFLAPDRAENIRALQATFAADFKRGALIVEDVGE